jgi:hypothetical protein
MRTLRRLLLLTALLGSVLGGYVFSVGTAAHHAVPERPAIACGGAGWPCM